jgi:hypothetical protein
VCRLALKRLRILPQILAKHWCLDRDGREERRKLVSYGGDLCKRLYRDMNSGSKIAAVYHRDRFIKKAL